MNIIGLIPIVPDFAIELRSDTDSLIATKTKMENYQRVGVRLGLLVDPKNKQVEVYRQGHEPEILNDPQSLVENLPLAIDCNEVMPGFILDMSKVW